VFCVAIKPLTWVARQAAERFFQESTNVSVYELQSTMFTFLIFYLFAVILLFGSSDFLNYTTPFC